MLAFDYNNPAELAERLRQMLPPEHWLAFQLVEATAQAEGQTVYLVGGIVRDLLLGRANFDLDFVCLQSARPLARLLLAKFEALPPILSVKLTEHADFATARLDLAFRDGQKLHLDFAMARREIYAHPAALPTVDPVPVSLEIDLQRRDFTINAVALSLTAGLIDPYDGVSDIRRGWLRILHDASFEDDPTRMVRGVRFAARFGYSFESHTKELLQKAVAARFFDLLSPERKRNELALLLVEAQPETGLALLEQYALLAAIHPALSWNEPVKQPTIQLRANLPAPPSVAAYLAALLHLSGTKKAEAVVKDLGFWGEEARVTVSVAQLWEEVRPRLLPNLKNSQLYALLQPFRASSETLPVFEALLRDQEPQKAGLVAFFLKELSEVRPQIGGDFLKNELGLKPGPHFRIWLNQLQNAVLDGELENRAAQELFLRRITGEEPADSINKNVSD